MCMRESLDLLDEEFADPLPLCCWPHGHTPNVERRALRNGGYGASDRASLHRDPYWPLVHPLLYLIGRRRGGGERRTRVERLVGRERLIQYGGDCIRIA